MNAVIIDDEVLISDLIKSLVEKYQPTINILKICNDVESALEAIITLKPDLIFLDIQLHEKTAYDILNAIDFNALQVIVITAYEQHAIKMYEYNIAYYLLKPIDVSKFISALKKVTEQHEKRSVEVNHSQQVEFIALPGHDERIVVPINTIVRVEAKGNYCMISLTNNTKNIITKKIGEFEKLLPTNIFIRIHSSHIINSNHIVKLIKSKNGSLIMSDNFEVPVSASRKNLIASKIAF